MRNFISSGLRSSTWSMRSRCRPTSGALRSCTTRRAQTAFSRPKPRPRCCLRRPTGSEDCGYRQPSPAPSNIGQAKAGGDLTQCYDFDSFQGLRVHAHFSAIACICEPQWRYMVIYSKVFNFSHFVVLECLFCSIHADTKGVSVRSRNNNWPVLRGEFLRGGRHSSP